MRLLAMVTDPSSITRYLRALDEPTDLPAQAPARATNSGQLRASRPRLA